MNIDEQETHVSPVIDSGGVWLNILQRPFEGRFGLLEAQLDDQFAEKALLELI